VTDFAWLPPDSQDSNVARFMAEHGIDSLDALRREAVERPDWFWDAVVHHLELPFRTPYESVLDTSQGIQWATWFGGGELNLADACCDRWAAEQPQATAIRWEGEDGAQRTWTWEELRAHADGIAAALAERGVRRGDRVGIYLPMIPEVVAAVLGVAKLGAVFLPLFSGYESGAIVSRLTDGEAVALITAEAGQRRGRRVDMLGTAVEAVEAVPSVRTLVVAPRSGEMPLPATAGNADVVTWPGPGRFETALFPAEHPLFVAYTSGTTGRPKGCIHVHGGWLVKVAAEGAFQTDCRRSDTLFWFTDMGWIMGPWEVTAALSRGATLAMYEGVPDWPDPGHLWRFVAEQRVDILGISPTLVRALMTHGRAPVEQADLTGLRILASTGEPWNDVAWQWYFDVVGGRRCPVINMSGGTEAGCLLAAHPNEPLKPCSLGGPALGVAADVFDEQGHPVRSAVGELVCTAPWPSMTRGVFGDPERYLATYWNRWGGVWVHGDWASIDADGQWFLHGRSDDTLNIAGKRIGPAEIESVLVAHPGVAEAAAVGVPDDVKGESVWAFVVPASAGTPELADDLRELVAAQLGKSFRPGTIRFTTALPKTRSAKVLRRTIRAIVTDGDLGDLSGLDDPTALDAIRASLT
jgi:acetyl-CoA synthetase